MSRKQIVIICISLGITIGGVIGFYAPIGINLGMVCGGILGFIASVPIANI